MTNKEAAAKLSAHLMSCGMLMPIEWVEKNGEGSELAQAFRLALDELNKEEPAWISVEERLPEEFVSVLICIPSEAPLPMVKEAYLANGFWATKMGIFHNKDVTHWMPLPEPPAEAHP